MEEGLLLLPGERREEGKGWPKVVARWLGEHKEEGKKLGSLAAPLVVVTVSQSLLRATSLTMVGHLGEVALAGTSLATCLTYVTGFCIMLGMASGLETLCGQAYGAKEYQKLGIHTYRAIFALVLACLPITLVWVLMGKLLHLIGQDPLISLEAGKYAKWMIPGLFAHAFLQPLMKFLQSQSLIAPMVLSSIATLCLHIPLCWVLVFKSGLDNAGGALAISISYWLNVFILGMYVRYSPSCKATRSPLSKEAFKGIDEFLRLALPSAFMICLEGWSFELVVLLSGLLPNPKLEASVLSICLNILSLLFTIQCGLGSAASTRVSNELGAGNPHGAQLSVHVVMFIAVAEAMLVSSTLLALRRVLGYAYSNEQEVTDYVTKMFPLNCAIGIADNLQGVLSGLENAGAALAIGISYWLDVFILGMYIKYSPSCKATHSPFSKEAFKGIDEFLRLALPSALMICLDWWSFELVVLLSGILPNPKLETSVLSICLNTFSLLFTIPTGLATAVSTRVSNELGAGNPQGARLSVRVVMFIAVTEAMLVSSILFCFSQYLGLCLWQ